MSQELSDHNNEKNKAHCFWLAKINTYGIEESYRFKIKNNIATDSPREIKISSYQKHQRL